MVKVRIKGSRHRRTSVLSLPSRADLNREIYRGSRIKVMFVRVPGRRGSIPAFTENEVEVIADAYGVNIGRGKHDARVVRTRFIGKNTGVGQLRFDRPTRR